MRLFRKVVCASIIALGILALGAGTVSAQTFYVEGRGEDTNTCTTPGEACETINGAIKKAEAVTGPNRIEVEPGLYHETLALLNPKDSGLTINGETPGVVVEGKKDPALIAIFTGSVTLSNLKLEASRKEAASITNAATIKRAAVTLNNVAVENEASGGTDGIALNEAASLTMNGGSVEMEGGSTGNAVSAYASPVALTGVKILNGAAAPDEAGGVVSEKSSLSMVNTSVSTASNEGVMAVGTGYDSLVSISNVSIRQEGSAAGANFENSNVNADGLRIEMLDNASTFPALLDGKEGQASTIDHLTVNGTWAGRGVWASGGGFTLLDSHVTNSQASAYPALFFDGYGSAQALLVQRSVLQDSANAHPGALQSESGNVTVDSSEILGGKAGIVPCVASPRNRR